ncbi:MAG: amylo-alpha-1,6-glucosidase [Candidatus Obscuribacterales bacterium]|nr:amylo-alpha-1,6-glucosidase [Candidatus Obscuribacterales bacterium]
MTFGLIGWLKSRHKAIDYDIPVYYPSRDKRDNREWLVVNGLGGYSMGTICGANRRRYHCVLAAALYPPVWRHIVLSRVEELITIGANTYELATSSWTSGVISPTGYKHLESFTFLPVPTWVFELNGRYLIKQLVMPHGKNEVYLNYHYLGDLSLSENTKQQSSEKPVLTCRFLVGFRDFHKQVKGSSDDRYPQFVSPNQSMVILNESGARLCLTWQEGQYEAQKQWWWDYKYTEETNRGEPDNEDLFLVGAVTSNLRKGKDLSIGASFENAIANPDGHAEIEKLIERQNHLIKRASLPRSQRTDQLILACDQFLVPAFEEDRKAGSRFPEANKDENRDLSVLEGYPWFNDSGRAALMSLPGLCLSTRRFAQAKAVLRTFAGRRKDALVANRTVNPKEDGEKSPTLEYNALDTSFWFFWSTWHYYRITRDKETVSALLDQLCAIFTALEDDTIYGIKLDNNDGLISCELPSVEFSWMDSRVAEIPITPRAGKAVDLNSLWYNALASLHNLLNESELEYKADEKLLNRLENRLKQTKEGLKKFWNSELSCLYDVIDTPSANEKEKNRKKDASLRPNQLFAVALPYRAFERDQEKQILAAIENELITPMGIRTLSPTDAQYQGLYGCGFEHADQYHRDLSYHQGTAWPFLLGFYCDALLNVYGPLPETKSRIKIILSPLLEHLGQESLVGGVSEIFDGARPHLARGCPAYALSTAELMRWQTWLSRQ